MFLSGEHRGKSLDNTGEEYIAFPYGNNIRAGAKTEISDVASFYNY